MDGYSHIICEKDLLEAFVMERILKILDSSNNISADVANLKNWFDNYVKYADTIREAPKIDWDYYLLMNKE